MLHKLALATTASAPSLLEAQFIAEYTKEAMISAAEHAKQMAKMQAKQVAMAQSRGESIPLVDRGRGIDPVTKQRVPEFVPDLENARINKQGPASQRVTEVVTPATRPVKVPGTNKATVDAAGNVVRESAPGAGTTFQKTHRVPGASVSPGQGSALAEGEIQRAYGNVSNSKAKQLKHTYWGGAKRFWGGKGLTGRKWGNRGVVGAGVGALGLGMKAYLDSNKARQPESLSSPEEAQQQLQQAVEQPQAAEMQQQQQQEQQWQQQLQQAMAQREAQQDPYYPGQQDYYSKMGSDKYSPDAVTIPKPTAQPTVKALGPGISSIKSTGMGGGKGGLLGGMSSGSGGGSSSTGGSTKQSEDSGVLPLLGAAAGGAGGWALGKKFIAPALDGKKQELAAEIARKQKQLSRMSKATSAAPLGAAAAGALLLAALAALYAKRDKGGKGPVRPIDSYDSTGAGFSRHDYNPYGDFYG